MLNKFSKVILFYLAYLPLILMLLVLNLDLSWWLLGYCGLALLLGIIPSIILLKTIKSIAPEKIKTKIIENKNAEIIGFILTYILPFCVEFTSLNHIISFGILIIVIFFIYIDTSLFSINPLLKVVFGYSIYEVTIEKNENKFEKYFLLSKKKKLFGEKFMNLKELNESVVIED